MLDTENQWDLAALVTAAGRALQKEDTAFRKDLENNIACPGQRGGILRMVHEHYFQFVIARAYAAILPYIVKVEDCRRDITFSSPQATPSHIRHTVIEMKRWFSASGEPELHGIRTDIFKKLLADVTANDPNSFRASKGLMFLISANPPGLMTSNLVWLADKLGINNKHWETFLFETENINGDTVEFWLAGFDVHNIVPAIPQGQN